MFCEIVIFTVLFTIKTLNQVYSCAVQNIPLVYTQEHCTSAEVKVCSDVQACTSEPLSTQCKGSWQREVKLLTPPTTRGVFVSFSHCSMKVTISSTWLCEVHGIGIDEKCYWREIMLNHFNLAMIKA